jgi:ABC-2 type transport system ATP-binding protein
VVTRGAGVLLLVGALLAPSAARAEELTVRSFDGTPISAEFRPADGLAPGQRAPTILETHGFGLTRETVEDSSMTATFGQVGARAFRRAGFNTLTWDSRGFGRSGGEVQLDAPQVDGRDVSALLDALARRPEAQLDGPGDPRAGIHGASYGGGIEWSTAINDRRIDAMAPAISFVSLTDALVRDGRVKLGWGLPLVGLGATTGLAVGLPFGQTGGFPTELTLLAAQAAVTGDAPEGLTRFLAEREVGYDRAAQVRAPTLIVQGTADTLFPPTQAIRMREALRKAKVPAKMLWFCGGHGACLTGNPLGSVIERRVLAWMDRYVKGDTAVDTGPGFSWAANDGRAYEAADFPLAGAGSLSATSSGDLPISPLGITSGLAVAATPAANAVEVDLPPAGAPGHVVGEPEVAIRYRGTASTPRLHLYAQVVDVERNVVVGNQATPIPVLLDGAEHEVTRRLEAIAARVGPSGRLRLQITDGSNLYGATTAVGLAKLLDVRVSLPLGDPERTRPDPATAGSAAPGAAPCASRRTITLRLARRGRGKVGAVRVRVSSGRVSRVRRLSRGRVRFSLAGSPRGSVRVRVTGRDVRGRRVAATRTYRLCVRSSRR